MRVRLNAFAIVLIVVILITGGVNISAQKPTRLPASSSVIRTGPNQPDSALPCNEVCSEETDCNERCGTISCGVYGVYGSCDTCEGACGPAAPCELYCLDQGVVTTCGASPYECGGGASDCEVLCQGSVGCSQECFNGETQTTCGAENYPCEDCYQNAYFYVGVWEDVTQRDELNNPILVDCYASAATLRWDPCDNNPTELVLCEEPQLISEDEQPGTCCYYYSGNWGGCGASWGC